VNANQVPIAITTSAITPARTGCTPLRKLLTAASSASGW
jgi:hypothetical protein